MIELEAKEKKYDLEKHKARLDVIIDKWDDLMKILDEELPSSEEIEALLRDELNSINRTLPSFKHMTALEVRKEEFEKTSSKKIKRFLYK